MNSPSPRGAGPTATPRIHYGHMQPMSISCGSRTDELTHLFGRTQKPSDCKPTPRERRLQFGNGLESRNPDAVRAYSTSNSTYGSGRTFDEYPPRHLATTARWDSLQRRAGGSSQSSRPSSRQPSTRQPFGDSLLLSTNTLPPLLAMQSTTGLFKTKVSELSKLGDPASRKCLACLP